jgi:hypothetical protein
MGFEHPATTSRKAAAKGARRMKTPDSAFAGATLQRLPRPPKARENSLLPPE